MVELPGILLSAALGWFAHKWTENFRRREAYRLRLFEERIKIYTQLTKELYGLMCQDAVIDADKFIEAVNRLIMFCNGNRVVLSQRLLDQVEGLLQWIKDYALAHVESGDLPVQTLCNLFHIQADPIVELMRKELGVELIGQQAIDRIKKEAPGVEGYFAPVFTGKKPGQKSA